MYCTNTCILKLAWFIVCDLRKVIFTDKPAKCPMAPKEAATLKAVYDYLVSTNRPYSVNDIVMNLHKEHGKAAVQRVLDQMVEEDKLKIKLNGKQSCFYANQEMFETCSEQELAGLDKNYAEIVAELKVTGEQVKQAEAKLRVLTGSLTNAEAGAELEQLTSENKKLGERLRKLENNQGVSLVARVSFILPFSNVMFRSSLLPIKPR